MNRIHDGVVESALRLLSVLGQQPLAREDAPILAAAAAVAEQSHYGLGFERARGMRDPVATFVAAVACEAASPAKRTEELHALGDLLPTDRRPEALAMAEPTLARIDPLWAWSLITLLLDRHTAEQSGDLGLYVAAYAERADVSPRGQGWSKTHDPYHRQLIADHTARRAIRGNIRKLDDPALVPLLHGPSPGWDLRPSEAAAYLVAAAAIDSTQATNLAKGCLLTHPPEKLTSSLCIVAQAAVRAGVGARIARLGHQRGFITEQAHWILAAAAAHAFAGIELTALISELAPRVTDELDAGREWTAAIPLLVALAHAAEADIVLERATSWRIPPPLLFEALFTSAPGVACLRSHPALKTYVYMPEASWCFQDATWSAWWSHSSTQVARLTHCQDMLVLIEHMPWIPLPGSLADLTGWL